MGIRPGTGSCCDNGSMLVQKFIGTAFDTVKYVADNMDMIKFIFDFMHKYNVLICVSSAAELSMLDSKVAKFARVYKTSTSSKLYTDYIFVEGDMTGIPANDSTTGTWVLISNSGIGQGEAIPWLYNDGYANGGETVIVVNEETVGIPEIFVNGNRQHNGKGFTFNPITNSVTLADALEEGDEFVAKLWGLPALPDTPTIDNFKFVNWLYNRGSAVGGETTLSPPYVFQRVPAIFVNGKRYEENIHYTVNFDTYSITLLSPLTPLKQGDLVVVQLGGEADVWKDIFVELSKTDAASKINTSSNQSVETVIHSKTMPWIVGAEVNSPHQIVIHNDTAYTFLDNLPFTITQPSPQQDGGIRSSLNPIGAWANVGDISLREKLYGLDGFKLAPSLQPKPVSASFIYADRNAGVLPTNTSAVNGAIVNSLLLQYDEVILVEPVPLGNVVVSARKVFRSMTRVRVVMDSTVSFGLKVERGSVGSIFSNLVFNCSANNQIAYIQDGQSGNLALSYPQYSNYYNCDAEGDHVNGTTALLLSYTWSNKWYGCNFNKTVTGVVFGRDTDPDGFVNANHFYGCELRSDKTQSNSGSPIIHNSGSGNSFIGGAIENWFGSLTVIAGHLIITGGCYLEAMDTTYHVSGGRLVMDGCHDNGPAIVIDADGSSLVYINNLFTGSEGVYTNNYPKIQRRGDLDAEIVISGVKPGRSSSVLIRPGEWRTSGGFWSKTSPRKSRESINYGYSSMSARVGDDQPNVTGTDNLYTVKFNNTTIDADSGNEFNATVGIFTANIGGMRNINAGVYLSGVTSGQLCELFVITSERKYLLGTRRGDGVANIFLSGGVSIPLSNGTTVKLQIVAHGSSTNNVSILRGNAVDGYSYLSIVR